MGTQQTRSSSACTGCYLVKGQDAKCLRVIHANENIGRIGAIDEWIDEVDWTFEGVYPSLFLLPFFLSLSLSLFRSSLFSPFLRSSSSHVPSLSLPLPFISVLSHTLTYNQHVQPNHRCRRRSLWPECCPHHPRARPQCPRHRQERLLWRKQYQGHLGHQRCPDPDSDS